MGNWAIPGYWAKKEPEVWDLENQTRQKEVPEGLEWEGSWDLFGQRETRSIRPGCQESERLEHKTIRGAFLHFILKDKREPRG